MIRLKDLIRSLTPTAQQPGPVGEAAAAALAGHRMPLFHPKLPAVFLWSEKSGCTNLVKWFFYQADLLFQALDHHPWVHNYENEVYKTPAYLESLKQELLRGERPLIKFTRNPFSRAVSSFLMLSHSGLAKPEHFAHQEWRKIRAFRYGDPDSREGLSFRDFLSYLEHCTPRLGRLNSHFAQQYHEAEANFEVVSYDIGQMSAVFTRLQQIYGLHPYLDSLFASGHHTRYAAAASGDFSGVKITEQTFIADNPPPYTAFYDAETQARVAALFKNDFERYGYATDSLSDKPERPLPALPEASPGEIARERSPQYQISLSRQCLAEGHPEAALTAAEAAVALTPGEAHAENQRALALIRCGRVQEALLLLLDLIARHGEVAGLYLTLAIAFSRKNRFEEAMQAIRRARVLRPDNPAFANKLVALEKAQARRAEKEKQRQRRAAARAGDTAA